MKMNLLAQQDTVRNAINFWVNRGIVSNIGNDTYRLADQQHVDIDGILHVESGSLISFSGGRRWFT